MKAKTIFVCRECGTTTIRPLGRCPECGCFDSFDEEILEQEPKKNGKPRSMNRAANCPPPCEPSTLGAPSSSWSL